MRNKKGFTLAELLIVVAIIAVLVAIAIPIFITQLEKSRDATSIANIRSAYAEAQASYLTEIESDSNVTITKDGGKIKTIAVKNVALKGVQSGWSGMEADLPNGVKWSDALTDAVGGAAGNYTLTFNYENTAEITLTAAKNS